MKMTKERGRLLGACLVLASVVALMPSCGKRLDDCTQSFSCGSQAAAGGSGGQLGAGAQGGSTGATCAEECEDPKPVCDGATGLCVECTEPEHCDGGFCELGTKACVECRTSGDCADALPRCDGGSCEACVTHEDCEGRDERTRCDEDSGACVECLPGEHELCGQGSLCHGQLRRCVTATAQAAQDCRPCVADAHCMPGTRCVELSRFGEQGYACLPELGSGCDRPYMHELLQQPTIDGGSANVCGHRFTSCAGLSDFLRRPDDCKESGHVGSGDGACGLPGTGDNTRCRADGLNAASCTYRCQNSDDCICGFACEGGANNSVCMFDGVAAPCPGG